MKTQFYSEGLVYGNFWGGGKGAYPAKNLNAETKKELIKEATEMLDGRLDSGMGFESLNGAVLLVTKVTTTYIDEKEFTNKETEEVFIGNLTKQEVEFLTSNLYNL